MKKFLWVVIPAIIAGCSPGAETGRGIEGEEAPSVKTRKTDKWPVLRHYDQDHLAKIALPLGGIGTGTVSLGGKGDLRDWEIMNRPAKGFSAGPGGNRAPFFALYVKPEGEEAVSSALMGPVEYFEYECKEGRKANNHGLPRFRKCSFAAAYPLGQVFLSDENIPVEVRIKAFNPLIPGDAESSGIPVAILRYELTNKTKKPLIATVCGVLENFIGVDGSQRHQDWKGDLIPHGASKNRNQFKKTGIQGIFMYSEGVDPKAEQWGTIALITDAKSGVSYRTGGIPRDWGNALLDFWDDFTDDGILEDRKPSGVDDPMAALAVQVEIPPVSVEEITFLLTWHFPNRVAWASSVVGNYYTTRYEDAWEVAELIIPKLAELEQKTVEFVHAFCETDLPEVVKEATLFNLSTLRSQTCFRTADGRFYGWEGCMDDRGSCHGSCTHVWNYEQATAFLFGELALKMREVEFGHATGENGLMSFRVSLPLDKARTRPFAAADGQLGTVMKMYRDWQLSGNDSFLEEMWPKVKKALEFCWIEGGWDADRDGVMEGCQHNTMDVEYFGPNPQMELWYLGALRASEEMANYLGDREFAVNCRKLYKHGSRWTDENLFNGEYYIHLVQPPASPQDIAPGLTVGMGAKDVIKPDYQIAEGCLVDQLVGQYMAHVCNLGYLVKPENVRTTLKSIMRYNYRESLHNHFNCMRSYALGDESALLMASYPYNRPRVPFPYFSEVMTGFEYTAAVGMLYEGHLEDGLRCIRNIRARYDGRKRSPFNEAECGHHYARAMASWAAVLALTGFHYSKVKGEIFFTPQEGNYFWSNGYAWGTCKMNRAGEQWSVELSVLHGELDLTRFVLRDFGIHELGGLLKITPAEPLRITVERSRMI